MIKIIQAAIVVGFLSITGMYQMSNVTSAIEINAERQCATASLLSDQPLEIDGLIAMARSAGTAKPDRLVCGVFKRDFLP